MVNVMLATPVLNNFEGYTRMMASVDIAVTPYVHPNYDNGNEGVSKGWNSAIDKARVNSDVLIVCNDDIVFEPGCLGFLVGAIRSHRWDLVTAINTRDFPTMEDGMGHEHEPDFACFALDPVLFLSKFGYFDEKFSPAYFEDNDMAYRMNLEAGRYHKMLDARMYHAGSQTQFKGKGPDSEDRVISHEQFRANEQYYIAKWGGRPGEEQWKTPYNNRGSTKEW